MGSRSRRLVTRSLQALCGVLGVVALALGYVAWSTSGDPIPSKRAREQRSTEQNVVNDVTELNPVTVVDIVVPHTLEEIVDYVKRYDHVSIGGGRNSMGGQTASERAVQLDMREYNQVVNISDASKEITVQAGARWRDIQDDIDPHGLAVQIMQTYANFTVGGSLSVNVHGRYVGLGPIILSVKSFRIVLADGSLVEASPTKNPEIFYSAIGGMGGIGVITDVTLALADNVNLERTRVKLPTKDYAAYFAQHVRADRKVVFHNGDMYPPHFDAVSAVSWSVTDKAPTTEDRLIPRARDYWRERVAWVVMSQWPGGRWIREHLIDPIVYSGDAPVHTRNYEASYDAAELEPEDRARSTYVLQEYFVPVARFDEWIPKMKRVFDDYDVNVINVSIRHAIGDPGAKLAWARGETFAFVVYYKQGTDDEEKAHVATWTRAMTDEVLSVGGTYYLPYQLHASDDQFHRAYPGAIEYFEIKRQYDPADKFTNKLWDRYYSPEKLDAYTKKRAALQVASGVRDYYRPIDNAYLALPEWYIVYSADEYAAVLRDGLPSDFRYFEARRDYWTQYDEVTRLTASSTHDNRGYQTVLKVIGWSFTIENVLKGLYENTVGRSSEWVAGNTQVAEDRYAARVAQDYATFIYDYPWYDFPYFTYFKGVWTLDHQMDHTWLQDIRRLERKAFLSLEYGLKALYAKVIAFATHAEFGVQDDIVSAVVTRDNGATHELVKAPHYHPFTRRLLEELGREATNPRFQIADISGNERITLTYQDTVGAEPVAGGKEIIRDREIVSIRDGLPQYQDRITLEVKVSDIPAVYRSLRSRQVVVSHFYDY